MFIRHNLAGENSNTFITSRGQKWLLIKQVVKNGIAGTLSGRHQARQGYAIDKSKALLQYGRGASTYLT